MPYKLRIPDETVSLIRGLHPELKKRIRTGLQQIIADPHSGKALKDELKGLWSFRLKRIRIVYRFSGKKYIDIIALGPRRSIYEETFKLLKKKK